MKKLIINADDFGLDEDSFKSTVLLFEKKILSSATIMTDMPYTNEAIQFAIEKQDQFSFGLHFNIVDDHSAYYGSNSLTIENSNKFKSSNEQRKSALLYKLNSIDIQEEFECQITSLLKAGVKVSHIDSHGYLHKFTQIINAIKPIIKNNNRGKIA